MKIISYTDIEPKHLNADTLKSVSARVAVGKADGATHFCMRIFEIGKDGYTPKHCHGWEHEIFIHAGQGEVFLEGERHPVKAGFAVFIPEGEEHQIRNTGESDLVFACLIPSGFPEI